MTAFSDFDSKTYKVCHFGQKSFWSNSIFNQLGSAELISSHRQRVADVDPHSDDNDEKPPDFGQGKTKFPQELHHVFDEVAQIGRASCRERV